MLVMGAKTAAAGQHAAASSSRLPRAGTHLLPPPPPPHAVAACGAQGRWAAPICTAMFCWAMPAPGQAG